jgi:hypothetical protein
VSEEEKAWWWWWLVVGVSGRVVVVGYQKINKSVLAVHYSKGLNLNCLPMAFQTTAAIPTAITYTPFTTHYHHGPLHAFTFTKYYHHFAFSNRLFFHTGRYNELDKVLRQAKEGSPSEVLLSFTRHKMRKLWRTMLCRVQVNE